MQCNCSIYATTTQIGAKHATYTRHVTSAACYKVLIALWLCSYATLLYNVVSGLHVTCTAAVFFPQCQCTMYMICIIIMLHKLLLDYYYTSYRNRYILGNGGTEEHYRYTEVYNTYPYLLVFHFHWHSTALSHRCSCCILDLSLLLLYIDFRICFYLQHVINFSFLKLSISLA